MKRTSFIPVVLLALLFVLPHAASAEPQPETIIEKMAVKFTRGVTNIVTSPVEIPKQIILTGRDMDAPLSIVVGPLKGIGMTLYRATIGAVEAVFFTVPQPGYYDPTIDPAYVWDGWEPKRDTSPIIVDNGK